MLDRVDSSLVDSWYHVGAGKPSRETWDLVKHHRALYVEMTKQVLRDLPPSFERDQAVARLREAWTWTATCLLSLGPA